LRHCPRLGSNRIKPLLPEGPDMTLRGRAADLAEAAQAGARLQGYLATAAQLTETGAQEFL
jgi:hypothetical protein